MQAAIKYLAFWNCFYLAICFCYFNYLLRGDHVEDFVVVLAPGLAMLYVLRHVLNDFYLYKSMLFLRKDVFLEVVENSQHVLVIINLLLEQLLDQGG